MSVTAITITRDKDLTAFCDTGAFIRGKCRIEPNDLTWNCQPYGRDICCIVCDLIKDCDQRCERINPDD